MMHFSKIGLVCLASGSLLALVGCSKQEPAQTTVLPPTSVAAPALSTPVAVEKVARPPTVEEVAEVSDGTQLISPESGKPVVKQASTPVLVYDGRLYFFCCAVCVRKCEANPNLLKQARQPNGFELRKLSGSGA